MLKGAVDGDRCPAAFCVREQGKEYEEWLVGDGDLLDLPAT